MAGRPLVHAEQRSASMGLSMPVHLQVALREYVRAENAAGRPCTVSGTITQLVAGLLAEKDITQAHVPAPPRHDAFNACVPTPFGRGTLHVYCVPEVFECRKVQGRCEVRPGRTTCAP